MRWLRDYTSFMPTFIAILLGTASLLTVGLIVPVFLLPPAQGYSGIGALLLMLAAASLRWALLASALGWCIRRNRFDWLPRIGVIGRVAIVMGAHLVL